MKRIPLSQTKIETKLAIVRQSLDELELLAKIKKQDFVTQKQNFPIAEHYLRRALEAIFDISGHVISRFPFSPGKRPSTYKGLALAMGEKGIISKSFAQKSLVKMAGFRNRMVHFYDEISPEELYQIIRSDLNDLAQFCTFIARLAKNPQKLGLSLEP
jgi:uncharacterized protein YutE (UPF0331/DUF86 family)